MGSDGPADAPASSSSSSSAQGPAREPARGLFGGRMLLAVWLPIAVITALHYGTSMELGWVHDVLRRSYYLPIVVAAFVGGLPGAASAAIVTSLLYVPHAFLGVHHHDPADALEKILEIVLYNGVGFAAGLLAERERRRRQELQVALVEQQALVEQLVRAGRLSALGQVVAGITHEIKNPLHALAGTAEIVDPLIPAGSEERAMWEIHVKELRRLQRIAERFLSFARPGPSDLALLDLRAVAQRLQELCAAEARRKRVALVVELPPASVPILGDRDQLASLALNIAVNAFDALGDGGGTLLLRVTTVSAAGGPRALLRLENDGPPLRESERARLFDPFYSGRPQGTGLGLAIASQIARQHDGYLEADNAGLGVAFTLTLPLRGDPGG
ncbi:MAG: histidine kinase dimerization/phospho-acceptor domain-containing protein [Nannocystaceae bacterium]